MAAVVVADMDKLDNRVLVVHLAAVEDNLHTQLVAEAVAQVAQENTEDV